MINRKQFKRAIIGICLGASLVAIAGCASVIAQKPIGNKLTSVDSLDLSGVWRLDNKAQNAQFIYAKQLSGGKLNLAFVQFKDGKFKLNRVEAIVTKNQDAYYINFPYNDKQAHSKAPATQKSSKAKGIERSGYTFARLIPRKDKLIVLPSSIKFFEAAVKNDLLKGRINVQKGKPTKVFLQNDSKTLNNFISPDKVSKQFELKHAIILKRVATAKGKSKSD